MYRSCYLKVVFCQCFVSVLCCFNEFVNHGGLQGNMVQALAQWWHPVALSEALDVLHWAMRLASYSHIHMANKLPVI
jgi:hypothetical protein